MTDSFSKDNTPPKRPTPNSGQSIRKCFCKPSKDKRHNVAKKVVSRKQTKK